MEVSNILDELNSLFNPNVVGLDIGTSSIKVCELSFSGKKTKLERFGIVDLSEGAIIEDEFQKSDELMVAIKEAIRQGKIKGKNVCFGMYGPRTIAKRMNVSAATPAELEDQIMWEGEQYIPFGADGSEIGHHVIRKLDDDVNDVMIAAVKTVVAENFQNLIKETGLKPKIADLNVLALNNVFEVAMGDALSNAETTVAFLDFGAQTTKLIVYKNQGPIFTREINVGGGNFTEEIQKQMGLSYAEAEDLKISGVESGSLPEEVSKIFEVILESIFSEVKKTLNFFLTASSDEKIGQCYITGGSSLVPGLREGIEAILEVPVEYFNPFNGIQMPRGFNEAMVNKIAAQGAVAIGLALRGKSK